MLKIIIGKLLYSFTKRMPESYSKIHLGQKKLRGFCGHLIMKKVGKNVNIEKNARFNSNVEIGNNSGLGINCYISGACKIGDDVMMGPNVQIYTRNHNHKRTDISMNLQGDEEERQVTIGNDVWIGASVIILPGARIGNHVILGAGTVVGGSIPDYAMVIGNPCIIKKYRNKEGND